MLLSPSKRKEGRMGSEISAVWWNISDSCFVPIGAVPGGMLPEPQEWWDRGRSCFSFLGDLQELTFSDCPRSPAFRAPGMTGNGIRSAVLLVLRTERLGQFRRCVFAAWKWLGKNVAFSFPGLMGLWETEPQEWMERYCLACSRLVAKPSSSKQKTIWEYVVGLHLLPV